MTPQFHLVKTEDATYVTLYASGRPPLTAGPEHPNFDRIVAALTAGDPGEEVLGLFDIERTANAKFRALSDRVTVRNGTVYLDGDPQDHALAEQIVRQVESGTDDWKSLVNFFENVVANPSDNSREQLYSFVRKNNLPLTYKGWLIAYKGLCCVDVDRYTSINSVGEGDGVTVNNVPVPEGKVVPQTYGDLVEMPRACVADNPGVSCSTGLHVGTKEYAQTFARGGLLKVYVNPRDVVSVPRDGGGEKVRVCRYWVAPKREQA